MYMAEVNRSRVSSSLAVGYPFSFRVFFLTTAGSHVSPELELDCIRKARHVRPTRRTIPSGLLPVFSLLPLPLPTDLLSPRKSLLHHPGRSISNFISSHHKHEHLRFAFFSHINPNFLSIPLVASPPNSSLTSSRSPSSPLSNPPSRWLTGAPLKRLPPTMVRIKLYSSRSRVIESRISRIHKVHARAIRTLHVILVRSMGLGRTLICALFPQLGVRLVCGF